MSTISIITPSYNQGPFIEETIKSVLGQRGTEIEYLVFDACSTDNTLDVLKRYEDKLVLIREPDSGQSDAINKGWRACTGDIVTYLNSDDLLEDDAARTVVTFFDNHPDIGMVYGDSLLINEDGSPICRRVAGEPDLERLILSRSYIPQPSAFFRREVLEKAGYLDENLHLTMDLDLWIRFFLVCKVHYIPQILSRERIYAGTKSQSQCVKQMDEIFVILEKTYARPGLPSGILRLKQKAIGSAYFIGANNLIKTGDRKTGIRYLVRGLVSNPGIVSLPLFHKCLASLLIGETRTQRLMDSLGIQKHRYSQ